MSLRERIHKQLWPSRINELTIINIDIMLNTIINFLDEKFAEKELITLDKQQPGADPTKPDSLVDKIYELVVAYDGYFAREASESIAKMLRDKYEIKEMEVKQ